MCWDIASWLRINNELSSQSDDLFREQMYLLNHLLNLRLGGCTNSNVDIYDMPWCVWLCYIGVIDGTIVKA
jgi:hypothetical protein